jgi:hypothetical protein
VEVDDEEYEEDGYDLQEVEIDDEDWEVADAGENGTSYVFPMCKFSSQFHESPDFTKQYNRMRQHQQALTAASSTTVKATSSAVPLPARNISRSRAAVPSAATSTASRTKLAPLATATATLPGVSSAPKAAYTKANQKDKADRATQEQVLDPRTKNVLASLVRKGLVESVGGCVSTGKEVGLSWVSTSIRFGRLQCFLTGQRLPWNITVHATCLFQPFLSLSVSLPRLDSAQSLQNVYPLVQIPFCLHGRRAPSQERVHGCQQSAQDGQDLG